MARPVTLFTGQWADLDIESMCQKAKDFGYDGLELACWGDHFEVEKSILTLKNLTLPLKSLTFTKKNDISNIDFDIEK